jgi:hypothetical protein
MLKVCETVFRVSYRELDSDSFTQQIISTGKMLYTRAGKLRCVNH